MLEILFPNGILHYLLGGILLGVSVSGLYILTGYIMGANAALEGFTSCVSKIIKPKFRSLRISLFVGIVLGALLYTLTLGSFFITQVQWWRLLIGGVFIGLGATLAKGCTSGHGIAGLASLSKSSFVYVALFMIVAIITANIVMLVGVLP